MTIMYDADLKGYVELISDDLNLCRHFSVKLTEKEYYDLLEGDEDEVLSKIARKIGEQNTASYYYEGAIVFIWEIDGKTYGKAFSPFSGERLEDYTIK